MLGRPKQFDHDEALGKAMEVFWTKGYEATSVQDLLDHMGINRGSLYDTFGDKHALFCEAVGHYGRTVMQHAYDTLAAPGSPLRNVRNLIGMWADSAATGKCRGCLITNTAVELAPHNPAVAEAVKSALRRLEKALHKTLERAVEAGELPAETNTRALARFLTSSGQGLVVMGKANVSRATIKDIVAVTLSVLE